MGGAVMKVTKLVKHLRAWEPIGSRRWFASCDVCRRRRIWARYHEVYYCKTDDDMHIHGWQWACTRCLAEVLGDIAEKFMRGEHEEANTKQPAEEGSAR
jgi:hypothetical protein